jgi:hypothetical protein
MCDFSEDEDRSEDGRGLHERELPDESDMDSFDEPGLDTCPYCRKMISEDAERCHHCGNYISAADAPRRALPWWFWIGVITAGVVALMWALRG